MNAPNGIESKPKQTLLPILTFLFVISYTLLAFLVVEQNKTIANQHSLIQTLMNDSVELTSLKAKTSSKGHSEVRGHSTSPAATSPATGNAPPKAATGPMASKADSPESGKAPSHTGKTRKSEALTPPKAADDKADVRRSVSVI